RSGRPQRRAAPSKVSPLGGQRPASAAERGGLLISGSLAWPGLAPAGDLRFFVSPKKRRPKKGEPKSGALRASLRCSARGGNSQTCPLRGPRTCEFLIPAHLRC